MLTYIDLGVLIAAARVDDPANAGANAVLGDPARSFASSDFVRLEVLPKATYHKRTAEVDFYNVYFDAVQTWVVADATLTGLALRRGAEFGLNGMDALHVAAAETAGAVELVTTERATSPLSRVAAVARHLHPRHLHPPMTPSRLSHTEEPLPMTTLPITPASAAAS